VLVEVQLYSFLTLALDGGGWSTPPSSILPSVPVVRRLGGSQVRSGLVWRKSNFFVPTGFDPPIFLPVP
jgi:hypothetical protein